MEHTLIHNAEGTKANLLATIPAHDGTTTGGIVLSGHTDVVPVDGQEWSSEPFEPAVREGKLYGRGTCDMKAFIGSSSPG
ncbi:M20/M25/M40 family metallo-hydrolase [Arthrobacter sp. JCM 19049]|uniref:M20/M25/M40 family metallo-hydrolase n=1 Tax=Arthrobacter sp. JCM 19049 TaxID=1460643 RepID=UPI000AF0DC91|nr:M20/M25/M40 family metallo-hydrolase [Arthrobacter sp. JCM 19049]